MSKLQEPPFIDKPNYGNEFWSQSWFEWLRDLQVRVNERVAVVGTVTLDHFAAFNADGDIVDSGKIKPSGEVVGTTDTQTLTNKTVDDLIITNAPTDASHATRKDYVDTEISDAILDSFGDTIVTETDYAQSPTAGVTDKSSRVDHTHGTPAEPFPIGAYYFNSTGVDPATELGYGTWTQVAQGLVLVGAP